ncbi:hypothetical protein [Streptomyces sp. NPDC059533]|uniref:hypothetical protein n=1 Tax=unclassified Streptomyces TaxID=2593676 RepID=UPI0036C075BA
MPFTETNPAMARLLARVDTCAVAAAEIPDSLRAVVCDGWVRLGLLARTCR